MCLFYCDKDCQKEDWKDHKAECPNLVKLENAKADKDLVRLMARVIVKLNNPSKIKPEATFNNETRSFSDLMSHEEDILNDSLRLMQFSQVYKALTEFMGTDCGFSKQELLDIFGKVCVNHFAIDDDDEEHESHLGLGLYLGASALDHSCSPNCYFMFHGKRIDVHLLEDVPEPSLKNLFVSYMPLLNTKQERQTRLKETYYFDCKCVRCQDENMIALETSIMCANKKCTEPVSVELECCKKCGTGSGDRKQTALDVLSRSAEMLKFVEKMAALMGFDQAYASAEKELEAAKMLHPHNMHQVRMVEFALNAAKETGKLNRRSVELATWKAEGYRQYYPKCYPNIGFQLWNLALGYSDLLDYKRSFLYFGEAEAILRLTYCEQHPEYQALLKDKLAVRELAKLTASSPQARGHMQKMAARKMD